MRQTAIAVTAILSIAALYHFRKEISSILSVLVFAAAFTIALSPLCSRLERLGMRPQSAAAFSALFLALLTFSVIGIILPYITSQILTLVSNHRPIMMSFLDRVSGWIEHTGLRTIQWSPVLERLSGTIGGFMRLIVRAGGILAVNAGKCVLAAVMSYYLLCERIRLSRHLWLMLPLPYRMPILNAIAGCRNAALGYLASTTKTSLFIFLATYVGLLFLRIPGAFFLSVLMALFEVVPYAGPVLASIPILLSAASAGPGKMLFALALVIAIQQIEGSFVGPHFAASSTALHPFTALAGVFVFGTLFGFWGLLLAIPLLSALQSIMRSFVQVKSIQQHDWI